MTTFSLPEFLDGVAQADGVTITYLDPSVQAPFDSSVYYDGQVLVVEGPGGKFSIEARGETRLSDGQNSWKTPEQFRAAFPLGEAGELEDVETESGDVYSYSLQNWFDIFNVPESDDEEWWGHDYAFSNLSDALAEAIELARQP